MAFAPILNSFLCSLSSPLSFSWVVVWLLLTPPLCLSHLHLSVGSFPLLLSPTHQHLSSSCDILFLLLSEVTPSPCTSVATEKCLRLHSSMHCSTQDHLPFLPLIPAHHSCYAWANLSHVGHAFHFLIPVVLIVPPIMHGPFTLPSSNPFFTWRFKCHLLILASFDTSFQLGLVLCIHRSHPAWHLSLCASPCSLWFSQSVSSLQLVN